MKRTTIFLVVLVLLMCLVPPILAQWTVYLPVIEGGSGRPTLAPTATSTYTPMPTKTLVPPTPAPIEMINGNFEQGHVGWYEYSTHDWYLIRNTDYLPVGLTPHSGSWAAWLGGDYDEDNSITQYVTVPYNKPYLVFWYWIASLDTCGYDVAGVGVFSDAVESTIVDAWWLCELGNTGGWRIGAVDLSAYEGMTLYVSILVSTDSTLNSNMFVDDVSFHSSATLTTQSSVFIPLDDSPAAYSLKFGGDVGGSSAVESGIDQSLFQQLGSQAPTSTMP